MSFSSWPQFSEEEVEAVTNVLKSGKVNYWTGDLCKQFEFEYASFVGVTSGIAVSNGTVAIELCLEALGISVGDEVVVPCRSFVATASAVVKVGAKVVFADVSSETLNINAESVKAVLSDKTKAVIAVHIGGAPCDLVALRALCDEFNLFLVEDCAQSHGASFNYRSVGSYGDAAAWSFCQDKIISTGGEGGMITTNSSHLADQIRSLKDHGKNFSKIQASTSKPGFKYVHDQIGSNGRMTEVQAAIGIVQLGKLKEVGNFRRQRMLRYVSNLDETLYQPLQVTRTKLSEMVLEPNTCFTKHAGYRLYLKTSKILKTKVFEGVACGQLVAFDGSCPDISKEKAFVDSNSRKSSLEQTSQIQDHVFCVLCDPTITLENIDRQVEILNGLDVG